MRVELRGLEPLTPTLAGRYDRVRSGSPPSRRPFDVPVRTRQTSAHGLERRQLQPQLQPRRTVAASLETQAQATSFASGVPEGAYGTLLRIGWAATLSA